VIRGFRSGFFEGRPPGDEEDLFSMGHGSSLFVMDLVLFLEERFGVRIEREDLDLENPRTIRAIADPIQRKRAG